MPVNHFWVGGCLVLPQVTGAFCVWRLWVLAAVGWRVWWLSCCLFGVESGECFLVFRHCRDWGAPGWDEADSGVESVHVAAPGRPLWVIVVNTVVVGAQKRQVLDVGKAARLPRHQMMDLAVISWLITAGPGAGVEFSMQGKPLFEVCPTF